MFHLPLKGRFQGINLVLAVGLLVIPLGAFSQVQHRDDLRSEVSKEADVVPGVVVLKLKSEQVGKKEFASIAAVQARFNGRLEATFPFLQSTASKKATGNTGLERIFYFYYEGIVTPHAVAQELAALPEVEYAEPKYMMRTAGASVNVSDARVESAIVSPNDALFGQMTHLQQIRLPEAWEVVKGEQGNVVIAIVDTGIDWRHQDLIDNVWSNLGEIPDNSLDDDRNGYIDDVHGWNFTANGPDPSEVSPEKTLHGTSTAGVAAAVADNHIGITGASWNARFMPITASCENNSQLCYAFEGVVYAAAAGADIVSCSWSGPMSSRFGLDVIRFAQEQDALVVAAAGNEHFDNDIAPPYPSSYLGVISVGATNKENDVLTYFSNYGNSVDVFAPGDSIDATGPLNRYVSLSGTSFSTPLVAGIAALVKTVHPDWNMAQVREQIRMTSDNVDAVNMSSPTGKMGRGRVNAYRAVTEEGHVSIRVIDALVLSRTPVADRKEVVELEIIRKNHLAPAQGIVLDLTTSSPGVSILEGPVVTGALSTGEDFRSVHRVELDYDVLESDVVNLNATVQTPDGLDDDSEILRFLARPPGVVTHETQAITFSLIHEGNLGWVNFAEQTPGLFGDITEDTYSSGDGFRIKGGPNQLFEGGIILASSRSQLSNNVRRPGSLLQTQGFRQVGESFTMVQPGNVAAQESVLELEETNNPDLSVGMHIRQQSFADHTPDHKNFIIVNYTLTNLTHITISPVYMGVYLDWDINPSRENFVRFDSTRSLGMVMNADQNPSTVVASMLLTRDAGVNFRAIIHDETELFDTFGFSQRRKWEWISGGIQRTSVDQKDVSTLLSAGSMSIDPGASVHVAFAFLGATETGELLRAADAAQAYWDQVIAPSLMIPTDTETPELPERFALYQNFPNPFNPETVIQFDLPEFADVQLRVFDLLGRQVASLHNGPMAAGHHQIRWNASQLPSGGYFYQITAGPFSQVRQMVFVK